MINKYIIVSPHGRGGGIIALHLLCKYLRNIGYNCKMFYPEAICMPGDSNFRFWIKSWFHRIKGMITCSKQKKLIPVSGCRRCYFPFVGKHTVVVYPEPFYGNPLHAKNVVRWLLYHPSETIMASYSKDDLVFAYRHIFNVEAINPSCRRLHLSSFDQNIFKQTNFGKREGCCYILHKGKRRNDLPSHYDGPVIDDWSFEDQVKALNKYEYCYIYDTQTGYSYIAALCGCLPIIILEQGKQKSDYISKEDITYGVAYGDSVDEIEYACKTRIKLIEHLKTLEKRNEDNIQYFINECESFFER